MRLPLAIPLDARNGSAVKDARMTNAVIESYQGRLTISQRGSLKALASLSGAANGVVCYNGELFALAGTTAYTAGAGSTPINCAFEGAEGSTAITNSGTGGTLTNDGSFAGNQHTISTAEFSTGTSSLQIHDYAAIECDTPISIDFLKGDHEITFDLWVDGSSTRDGFTGDLILELIHIETNANDFLSWKINGFWDGIGDPTYTINFFSNSFTSVEFSFSPMDGSFAPVRLLRSAGVVRAFYNGEELSATTYTLTTISGTTVYSNILYAYQLDSFWADTSEKIYVDDLVISNQLNPEVAGTVVSGQYDFVQSGV